MCGRTRCLKIRRKKRIKRKKKQEQETLTRMHKKNNLAAVMEMGAQFLHIMYIVSKIKPVLFGGKWLQFIYCFFFSSFR